MEDEKIVALALAVLVLVLVAGGLFYNDYECSVKARKQGMEYSWGPVQGCMVREQGGAWVDYDRLRMLGD